MIPFLPPKTVVFTFSGVLVVNACKHTTEHSTYNLYTVCMIIIIVYCILYTMYKLFYEPKVLNG